LQRLRFAHDFTGYDDRLELSVKWIFTSRSGLAKIGVGSVISSTPCESGVGRTRAGRGARTGLLLRALSAAAG
jgi:hypothetical protein